MKKIRMLLPTCHFLAHGFLFGVMAPDPLFDFLDHCHEVHFNVIKITLIHRLSPKADVLCGFGCFRGLDLCAQQGAQCREYGVLCCDAGSKGIIKILRYAEVSSAKRAFSSSRLTTSVLTRPV